MRTLNELTVRIRRQVSLQIANIDQSLWTECMGTKSNSDDSETDFGSILCTQNVK